MIPAYTVVVLRFVVARKKKLIQTVMSLIVLLVRHKTITALKYQSGRLEPPTFGSGGQTIPWSKYLFIKILVAVHWEIRQYLLDQA